MNNPTLQLCTPSEIETVISHHEKGGARPSRFLISCPMAKALKKSRMTDAPNPFAEIVKHSDLSCMVNFNYAGNVNAQRKREGVEGTFKAEANWFVHVSPAIVEHRTTGKRYVFVRVLDTLAIPTYTADGVSITRTQLLPYLPSDELTELERMALAMPPKGASNPKQGLGHEIQPIAIKLENIREIRIDGFTYRTIDAHTITPARISTTHTPAHAKH